MNYATSIQNLYDKYDSNLGLYKYNEAKQDDEQKKTSKTPADEPQLQGLDFHYFPQQS